MLADFLRMELRRVNPTLIPSLHRAAGQRHEHHGDIVEAIRYAQAAGDWHHAVRLLAENHLTLILDGRMAAIRDLLGAFPQRASIADAELALVAATADAAEGLYDESAAHIAAAERIACTLPDDRRRPVELGLAATRLWLARLRGDVVGASGAFRSTELSLTTHPPREGTRSSLITPPRWPISASRRCRRCAWTMAAAISSRHSRSRAGSGSRTWRWRASPTSRSRPCAADRRWTPHAGPPSRRSRSPRPTTGTPMPRPRPRSRWRG
jgi:LuxR family maltose regulon positive regulatory protein